MALELRTVQDVQDLSWGSTFFGVGGGGTAAEGLKLLSDQLAEHGPIKFTDINDLPDDAWTVTTSFMGNRAPLSPEQEAQKQRLGLTTWKYENNMVEAVKYLEKVTGKKVVGIVVPELGGANTPSPIATAVKLGIAPLDADYSSRALPEVAQFTTCIAGLPLTPIASVDKWGNKTLIDEVVSSALAERIGKMLATAAFGNTALALMLLPASVMRQYAFRGTITMCYELGKAVREALEAGKELVPSILQKTGGHELFRGKLVKRDWAVKDGYLEGTHDFEGIGEFAGHSFRTWYKNENHVTWLDGKPYVCSPDLIAQVELDQRRCLLNNECVEGQTFSIIGLPAREAHRDPKTCAALNPQHYGFDIPYVPMEQLIKD